MENARARLVISGLPLANLNVGQGAYTYRIILGLLRRAPEFSFRIIVPRHFDLPSEIPEELLVRLDGWRGPRLALLNGIYWSQRILAHARKLPPDAVFHSPTPIVGFGRPARTVVTIHDVLYHTFPEYYGRSGIRRLNMLATERYAARATLVLTQSKFSREDIAIKSPIPREKLRILSPWVDESFFHVADGEVQRVRDKFRLPQRFWLYLGGYDRRKNVEFLLHAYASACHERRDVPPLVLAGEIPSQRDAVTCDIRGAIRRADLKTDAILLPGTIPLKDLPAFYRASSLLIYPSLMEGFGLPPAEAMAVGTPLLAANNSSLPEVVEKRECLFNTIDPMELTSKFLLATQNEEQFVAKLPFTFREKFGIQRYLELISEAAAA